MHLGKERTQTRGCVYVLHSEEQLHSIQAQHQRTGKAEVSVVALALWCVWWHDSQEMKGQRANRQPHQRTSGLNTVPFSLLLQWLQRSCMTCLSASVS